MAWGRVSGINSFHDRINGNSNGGVCTHNNGNDLCGTNGNGNGNGSGNNNGDIGNNNSVSGNDNGDIGNNNG